MQAYKLKGTIDQFGHLILAEPIKMPAGAVEIIVLQEIEMGASAIEPIIEAHSSKPIRKVQCRTDIFREWLENTSPPSLDFDTDQAKWEHLKEKHNL